jgi:ribosomal protein S18 acetylase RimI-like enzyme
VRLKSLSGSPVQDFVLQEFDVQHKIVLRMAQESDLTALEWWGWHGEHREIIRSVFHTSERGESLIIVADSGGFPIGQAWVDLKKGKDAEAALLWAVRVIPGFQGMGIGTRLIRAAENLLLELGYETCEVGVDEGNESAKRLYERLGYSAVAKRHDERKYRDAHGFEQCMVTDQWILRKTLA